MARGGRGLGLMWPFILIGLLFTAYSAYWVYMRGELEESVHAWIDNERARGAVVAYDRLQLKGFPYRFALHLDQPVYADGFGAKWSGEELQLIMQPWNWNHIIARSPGANEVDLRGAVYSAELGPKSAGSLSWTDAGLSRFSISLDDAVFADRNGVEYAARGLELHLRPPVDDADAVQLVLQWEGLTFPEPPADAAWLGRDVQPSRLLIEAKEAYPVLLNGGSLRDWVNAGGRLDVAQLLLNWGPLKFGGKADLRLDTDGALNGTVDVRLDDGEALRRAVLDAGLPATDFAELSLAIQMVDSASEDGGFLPLSVRAGEVRYLGQTLTDLPAVPLDR